jgi:hypothetical protein
MRDACFGRRPLATGAALLLAVCAVGCGRQMAQVTGTITLDNGSPLTRGLVVFEGTVDGKPVMARGEVKADGHYLLSTAKPGDGIPPGTYRVLINPLDSSDIPDEQKNLPFDYKYMRYDTSGLEYEVKPGTNDFSIKLGPPRRRR